MRVKVLRDLGHRVALVPTPQGMRGYLDKFAFKLGLPRDSTGVNAGILRLRQRPFDILWIDKGLFVRPETLQRFKQANQTSKIVGFSLDDMSARHNQSLYFLHSLPLFDCFITNKSYNVTELQALGAKRVVFIDNAYDRNTHRPISLSDQEKRYFSCDVAFVGTFELERAAFLNRLAESGTNLRVYGSDWGGKALAFEVRPPVYGDDYAKAICGAKINLGFLRRINRDLQTTRSIEIPACGSFMLAERTHEHLRLFEEGQEAEFFSSYSEAEAKIAEYLVDDVLRQRVAQAGLRRCLTAGYSYHDRLRHILENVL
jgi:spore maturation protein CgeB